MESNTVTEPTKIIRPKGYTLHEYFSKTWKYRHLVWTFVVQEMKVQYVQTRLNFLWLPLRPLILLGIFTLFFDKLIHLQGINYPYPLFAFTGLLVWNNFNFMVNNAGNVILPNQQVIKKMYFPKIILVLSKTLIGIAEQTVSLFLLLLLMILLHEPFRFQIIFVPVFLFVGILIGLSGAILLNTLSIHHRDLYQLTPTIIGVLIWFTPVFYPVSLIPKAYLFFIYFNPVAGIIQGCRWAILGDAFPDLFFLPAILFVLVLLFVSILIFIRAEEDFADYI